MWSAIIFEGVLLWKSRSEIGDWKGGVQWALAPIASAAARKAVECILAAKIL